MTYAKIVFVDNVTPLNALNMNKIDDGIYDNQSVGLKNQENVSDHFNAANKVHIYDNISTGIDNSSISFNATISTLKEEILTYRKHLKEIHGMDNWNDSSWYGTNISSHTIDINNLSEAVNVSIPNDIDNVSTQAFNNESSIVNLSGTVFDNSSWIQQNESRIYDKVQTLSCWRGGIVAGDYAFGGNTVDSLYQFENNIALAKLKISLGIKNVTGLFTVGLNDSTGEIFNQTFQYPTTGYKRESINLSARSITTSDGIAIHVLNISNVSSVALILNYNQEI